MAQLTLDISAKYGLDMGEHSVTKTAEGASVVVARTIREMPISTRGIGFNSALAYLAIERRLGTVATYSLCTIHQFYRVMLLAVLEAVN